MASQDVMRPDVRTLAWLTAAVLSAFALFALVRNARTPLTQLAIGVIIALALDPLVVAAKRRLRIRRGLAVAVVGLGLVVVGAVAVGVLGPPARDQAARFTRELPETVKELEDLPAVGDLIRRYDVEQRISEWVDELPTRLDDETISQIFNRVLSNVLGMLVVGATVIAVLLDGERMIARARRLFARDEKYLERADRVGRLLYTTLGQYFGGSLTVALMMGLFVLMLGLALGIPLAPLAALWATFTDLIPQVGGFLGGAFLVVLALAKGPEEAIIAGVLFILYMNLENYVISPAIVGESVNLSPPTTMLAAFIGGAVAGIPGALVATPLVGAAKRMYLEFRHGERASTDRAGLRERLRAILGRFTRYRRE